MKGFHIYKNKHNTPVKWAATSCILFKYLIYLKQLYQFVKCKIKQRALLCNTFGHNIQIELGWDIIPIFHCGPFWRESYDLFRYQAKHTINISLIYYKIGETLHVSFLREFN